MEENNQNTTENKKFNVPKNNGNFKEKGKVSFGKGVLIPLLWSYRCRSSCWYLLWYSNN